MAGWSTGGLLQSEPVEVSRGVVDALDHERVTRLVDDPIRFQMKEADRHFAEAGADYAHARKVGQELEGMEEIPASCDGV